jgi:lauroyl/myristoyl acyltransferase
MSLRDFAPTGDEQADAAELTRLIVRAMEPAIVRHPDQWFIFRHMWKDS